MKRKQHGLLRVIDISKKKKKKKKERKEKRKEKREKKRKEKYIGCSALANEKKAAWVASCDRYFLNRKIKRLLFGLGNESVSYIHRHQDLLVFGYMSDRLSFNSYHYYMVIGWLI